MCAYIYLFIYIYVCISVCIYVYLVMRREDASDYFVSRIPVMRLFLFEYLPNEVPVRASMTTPPSAPL